LGRKGAVAKRSKNKRGGKKGTKNAKFQEKRYGGWERKKVEKKKARLRIMKQQTGGRPCIDGGWVRGKMGQNQKMEGGTIKKEEKKYLLKPQKKKEGSRPHQGSRGKKSKAGGG